MSMQSQMERQEEILVQQLNDGLITRTEYNKEMRELHREYREMAEQSAEDAYRAEVDRW